jgi:hypothetical protein
MSTDVQFGWPAHAAASTFLRPAQMLLSPSRAVENIARRDALVSGALMLLLLVAGALLMQPFALQVIRIAQPSFQLSGTTAVALMGLQAVSTMVIACAKWGTFAYVLWAFGSAWCRQVRFSSVLALVVLAEGVRVLEQAFTIGLLALTSDRIRSLADLQPPIGLNLIAPQATGAVAEILNRINVFEAWYVVLLIIGTRHLFQTTTRTASLIVGALWLATFAVQAAVIVATR